VYTSAHSAVGIGIVLSGYLLAGPPGAVVFSIPAFASHDLLDRVGESSYGGLSNTAKWEAPAMIATGIASIFSGLWGVYLLGVVSGNLMDIIDKRFYLSSLAPDVYPPKKTFNCHRRSPNIETSLRTTKVISLLSATAIILTLLV